MNARSTLLLAGAALSGIVGSASATTIYGGGSSLIAPYISQAGNCYGDTLPYASNGKTATTLPAPFFQKGVQCSEVSPGDAISYISTGSGRAFLGFFSHDPLYGATQTIPDSWLQDGTVPTPPSPSAPAQYATRVNFGAADAGLPQTDATFGGDIGTYLNGGFVKANGYVVQVAKQDGTAPTGAPSGTLIATLYPNPVKTYGPAIQIPLLVAAPVVAFSPVYKTVTTAAGVKTSYAFTGSASFSALKTGALKLSNTSLCAIFTGTISDWNQLGTSVVNKAKADPAPFSVPLQIVGRVDGSGTTSILNRHLAVVCSGSPYATAAQANGGTVATKLPTSLQGPTVSDPNGVISPTGETPTKFTLVNGSGAVAKYLNGPALTTTDANGNVTSTNGRVGYIGEDFVTPFVLVNQQNTYNLFSTALQNSLNAYVGLTTASSFSTITKAFGTLTPPQSKSATDGTFVPANPGSRANAASDTTKYVWTSAPNTASPLANPTTSGSYPLVGTTNGLFYQCYANADQTRVVRGFLAWYYSSPTVNSTSTTTGYGILAANGFAPVNKAYAKAITETFINPTTTTTKVPGTDQLKLDVRQAGQSAGCTGVAGA